MRARAHHILIYCIVDLISQIESWGHNMIVQIRLHGRNFRSVKFSKKLEAESLELFDPRHYVNKEDESKSLFLQRA